MVESIRFDPPVEPLEYSVPHAKLVHLSRHFAPVRTIHRTASKKKTGVAPGSENFPRQYGSMIAHCALLKTLRVKAAVLCLNLEAEVR